MSFARLERDAWSDPSVTAAYAEKFAEISTPSAGAVVEVASVRMGCSVLDVACGPGVAAAAALERGAFPVGLDFSRSMLEIARRRVPGVPFVRGSASRLPFRSRSFDYVVCNLGLLHFPDPERAIMESGRVLRRGGRAAWSVWGADSAVTRTIPEAMENLGVRPELPEGPAFGKFAEEGTFEAALGEAAFVPDRPQQFAWSARFASAEEFLRMFAQGTARHRAALRAISPEDRERVGAEVAQRLERFRHNGGLEVPATVVIGSGLKP